MDLFWFLAQAEGASAPWWFQAVPIIAMVAIMYFLLLRPQMKEQKKHQQLINALKKGDRVITNGGIWGEVDAVDAVTVRLRIGEKMKIQVSRSHISGFQPASADAPAEQS